jgi:site-specific DNA-methyltransferase (adenine-specific)
MKDIPDASVDMVLCDLPYGTTACEWDKVLPLDELWKQYKRILKDDGVVVLTASQPFTTDLINSNRKWFRYCWVWEKSRPTGHLNAKKQPMRKTEDICVYYKNQCVYNPQGLIGGIFNNTRPAKANKIKGEGVHGKERSDFGTSLYTNYPMNILKFNNEHNVGKNIHPTQKPVALFEYLIKTYTNEGELVLDNCAGSGTTGVAAKKTGRKYILIEKEEKYCKIAQERLRQELLF